MPNLLTGKMPQGNRALQSRSEPPKIRGLQVAQGADMPTIYIYDEIGPGWLGMIDAAGIVAALQEIGNVDDARVRINSPGGDVFESAAIYNHLREFNGNIHVRVDGVAASGGSVIAMAGDTIEIAANAMVMIHEAWTIALGNKRELAKTVELLEKVDGTMIESYVARTGNEEKQIVQWVEAETWFTADEAVEHGFADTKLTTASALKPRVPKGRFKNTPRNVEEYEPRAESFFTLADPPPRPDREEPAAEGRAPGYSPAAIAARTRVLRARHS